jgi:hypothetical protein
MDEMGKNFWWKTTGIVIGLGVLLLLSTLVLDRLVYRFGAMGALVVIFGVGMIIAYRHDKKKQREYEEIP